MKTCLKCKISLPETDFYGRHPSGLQSYCKSCQKRRTLEFKREHDALLINGEFRGQFHTLDVEELNRRLTNLGVHRKEFAFQVGRSYAAASSWLCGYRRPRTASALAIVKYLGCEPRDILLSCR